MKDEKENYVFYYQLPLGRYPAMSFGWHAVWNGNYYGDDISLDLREPQDKFNRLSLEILMKFHQQIDASYCGLLEKGSEKGERNYIISDEFKKYPDTKFGDHDLRIVIRHLAANENAPEVARNAARFINTTDFAP